MALSWLNLSCALKAAIGRRKRTLGDPHRPKAEGLANHPHGLPRGDLAQPPEAGTCACLTLDAATAAFPDAAAVRTRGVTGGAEACVAFRASEERWLGTVSA